MEIGSMQNTHFQLPQLPPFGHSIMAEVTVISVGSKGRIFHQRDKNKQENKAEWLTFGFDATNIFHPSLSTFLEPWLVWVIQCQYRRIKFCELLDHNSCQNL